MNEDMSWENLGNGIIEQAHEDYIEALLLEHKAVLALQKAARLKSDVLKFYGNDWYYSLTTVDPATLLDTARKQADYIIWQRNNRCGVCDIEGCPHREERVNWKLWADGRRTCRRIKERPAQNKRNNEIWNKQVARLMNGLGLNEDQANMALHLIKGDPTGIKAQYDGLRRDNQINNPDA